MTKEERFAKVTMHFELWWASLDCIPQELKMNETIKNIAQMAFGAGGESAIKMALEEHEAI